MTKKYKYLYFFIILQILSFVGFPNLAICIDSNAWQTSFFYAEDKLLAGDYKNAEHYFKKALNDAESISGLDGQIINSKILNELAVAYFRQAKMMEAEMTIKMAIKMRRDLPEKNKILLGESLNILGLIYETNQKYDLAISAYLSALEIQLDKEEKDPALLARTYSNIGVLFYNLKKYKEAIPYFKNALVIKLKQPIQDATIIYSINNLAIALIEIGDLDDAEQLLVLALQLKLDEKNETEKSKFEVETSMILNNYADILKRKRNFIEAEKALNLVINIRKKQLGVNSPLLSKAYKNLAALYEEMYAYNKAEQNYFLALMIDQKNEGYSSVALIETLEGLTRAELQLNKNIMAYENQRKILEISERAYGKQNNVLVPILEKLSEISRVLNRWNEAEQFQSRANMLKAF
jgi:tetratricopeptide (TPR) repeat protein